MMSLVSLLHDNPVLVKHFRSQLRRQQFIPLLAVVVVIAVCITWVGMPVTSTVNWSDANWQTSMNWMFSLQGILLLLLAPLEVANSVAHARKNGMMDFHRVSPQHPAALALGFLLGGSLRALLLYACTLPFMLLLFFCALAIAPTHVPALLLVPLGMLISWLFFSCAALLIGLSVNVQKANYAGAFAVLLVIAFHFALEQSPLCYLTVFPTIFAILGEYHSQMLFDCTFFGVEYQYLLITLLHQLPLIGFLWLAVKRKMRREHTFLFSKPQALLFFIVLGLLTIGDLGILCYTNYRLNLLLGSTIVLYVLLIITLFVSAMVTPRLAQLEAGVRHARKLGLAELPRWCEATATMPVILCLGALYLLFTRVAFLLVRGEEGASRFIILLMLTTAVLTILYFGLALQCFLLHFRKNGLNYFGLLLFAIWVLPCLLGIMASITGADMRITERLCSFSPWAGIGLSLYSTQNTPDVLLGFLSAGMALLLVVIFSVLYRRVVRNVTMPLAVL